MLARIVLTLREDCYLGVEHHGGAVKAGAVKGLWEKYKTKKKGLLFEEEIGFYLRGFRNEGFYYMEHITTQ